MENHSSCSFLFSTMTSLLFTLSLSLAPQAFQPSYYNGHTKRARYHSTRTSMSLQQTRQLAEGVEFDTICREWRCKWSLDGDKASLVACQMALESVAEDLYQVDGVKAVERVVCGECLDFKVRSTFATNIYYNVIVCLKKIDCRGSSMVFWNVGTLHLSNNSNLYERFVLSSRSSHLFQLKNSMSGRRVSLIPKKTSLRC